MGFRVLFLKHEEIVKNIYLIENYDAKEYNAYIKFSSNNYEIQVDIPNDQNEINKLGNLYKKVLKLCYENNIYEIKLPLLGISNYNYSIEESFNLAVDNCDDFAAEYTNTDITLYVEIDAYQIEAATEAACYGLINDELEIVPELDFFSRDIKELPFKPLRDYANPMDFIDDYMQENNLNIKDFKGIITRQDCYKYRQGKRISKSNYMLMLYALNMSYETCIEAMLIAGFSFSLFQKKDKFYLSYLNGENEKVDLVSLNLKYYQEYGENLFE